MKSMITRLSLVVIASLMIAVIVAGAVSATAKTSPVFNVYDGIQLHYGVGSESDFLRLGNSGELGNEIEVCQNGTVDLWFYVHNSTAASQNHADLTGPGVATGTTVAVSVSDKMANSHSVIGTIDSDQTDPLTDDIVITCGSKRIKVSYKNVSYFGSPAPASKTFGNFTIKGDITDGATIGYNFGDKQGVVPGCWDYRARINVTLNVTVEEPKEVEEVEEAEPVPEEPEEEIIEEDPIEIPRSGTSNSTPLAVLVTIVAATATAVHYTISTRRYNK